MAILIPVCVSVLYVGAFGVNVPFGDDWSLVLLFDKLAAGTLGFQDLWAQLWEHRIFFPRIVILIVGSLTSFNTVAILYVIQACYIAMLAVYLIAFRSDGARRNLLFFAPIPIVLFDPGQFWVALRPISINLAFVQTFAMVTFFLLYISGREGFKKVPFLGALGSATVATFSSINGLLVWPVGFVQLLILSFEGSSKRRLAVVWSLIGAVAWIVYFISYDSPSNRSSPFETLLHPVQGAKFFLILLGNSIFEQPGLSLAFGIVLVGLAIGTVYLVHRQGEWGRYSFWLAILLFCLFTLAAITAGRGGQGGLPNTVSYPLFSAPAVISIYVLLVKLSRVIRLRAQATQLQLTSAGVGLLIGIILVSMPYNYVNGIKKASKFAARKEYNAFVVSTSESQPDNILRTLQTKPLGADYDDQPSLKENINVLKRLDYSLFAEPRSERGLPPKLSDLSLLETSTRIGAIRVNGVSVRKGSASPVTVPKQPFLKVTGWAIDREARSEAKGVYIRLDGETFPAFYGLPSQNLAKSLGEQYKNAAFERQIDTNSALTPGIHRLSIITISEGEEGYYRSSPIEFRIADTNGQTER